jgi:hypothetical protein
MGRHGWKEIEKGSRALLAETFPLFSLFLFRVGGYRSPVLGLYRDTPQIPRPPQTPSHSRGLPDGLVPLCGDQLILETS